MTKVGLCYFPTGARGRPFGVTDEIGKDQVKVLGKPPDAAASSLTNLTDDARSLTFSLHSFVPSIFVIQSTQRRV